MSRRSWSGWANERLEPGRRADAAVVGGGRVRGGGGVVAGGRRVARRARLVVAGGGPDAAAVDPARSLAGARAPRAAEGRRDRGGRRFAEHEYRQSPRA